MNREDAKRIDDLLVEEIEDIQLSQRIERDSLNLLRLDGAELALEAMRRVFQKAVTK